MNILKYPCLSLLLLFTITIYSVSANITTYSNFSSSLCTVYSECRVYSLLVLVQQLSPHECKFQFFLRTVKFQRSNSCKYHGQWSNTRKWRFCAREDDTAFFDLSEKTAIVLVFEKMKKKSESVRQKEEEDDDVRLTFNLVRLMVDVRFTFGLNPTIFIVWEIIYWS